LGRLLVFRDVTEEKLLAKMRDDLTHTMVHDLRNPLTGISVALQLLDSKLANVISPAQHRLFEIADHSTRRMIDLVNSILELTRLERGRIPLNLAPLSVADLVNETLRMQSPLAVTKNLQLENKMPPDLPLAWADAELVGRVLQNLVGNAVKFTPAGGVVRVTGGEGRGRTGGRAGGEAEPSPWLRVSVTDNGPGISPELQGRLFQRFVVGEQEGRGSGLGLAFCKLAVEAQEGEIWVDSEPGRGATFTFTLPIAREDSLTSYS
jgi:signal transduction histidine kinase